MIYKGSDAIILSLVVKITVWSFSFLLGGGLSGYVKSKPLGNGQIISIDVLVIVMIIAVFHKKLI